MGDIILVAGQIPLVPGNMNLLDMNIKRQCRLTLRHIDRIVKAMDAKLRDIVQGVCFLTHSNYIADARKEWERRTRNAIVDYVVVSNLPRGAQVEWCVWAHRDNNRFECKCKIFNKKSYNCCMLSRKPPLSVHCLLLNLQQVHFSIYLFEKNNCMIVIYVLLQMKKQENVWLILG